MRSEWELDEGIKSIKSAWWREHTARANLEKMLEQAEAENAKLRESLEYANNEWEKESMEYLSTQDQNAKLRELAHLLLWGVDNDMPRYEGLAWSQRVNTLTRELGVEP